jgi:hypothetical protein
MVLTLAEFQQAFARLTTDGTLPKLLLREFTILGLDGERAAKRNATTMPKVRTDRLRASIVGTARASETGIETVLSAGAGGRGLVRYAAMQEFGGIQRPRNAKMLRIPLGPALTGAGVDRYATPLRATAAGEFYVWKSDDGKLFLRKTDSGEIWYRLVSQVRIPATRYLGRAFDNIQKAVPEAIRNAMSEVLPGGVA